MNPAKSTAALIEDTQIETKESDIVQEYKHLNDKCDVVLDKINRRKKNSDRRKSK